MEVRTSGITADLNAIADYVGNLPAANGKSVPDVPNALLKALLAKI